ncbi:hypothetical protein BDZ91DRAFT_716930 [Kalaharituber pfeilii]|nr:hypothetical protein BDZ91DRAFT_716930 [Kalaharituber pfeilii]
MPSGFVNFLSTSLLTLTCSTILFLLYRHALAPMLKKHNIVPLRDLSNAISNQYHNRQYRRLGEEGRYLDEPGDEDTYERRISRDLEEGFRDNSDDEDAQSGDDRLRRSGEVARV